MGELTWGGIPYSTDGMYVDPSGFASKSDIAVVGLPYEGGASSKSGQSDAPFAIRRYEHFDNWKTIDIGDLRDVKAVDTGDYFISRGYAQDSLQDAAASMVKLKHNTECLVVLGGDHAVSAATSQVLHATNGDRPVDVIMFDAHADTWPIGEPGYWPGHESWVRWVMDKGYAQRVRQFGVRAMVSERHGEVPFVEVEPWQHTADAMKRFLAKHAKERPHVDLHLSVDLDVVEPALCPGVAYPEPGGWLPGILLQMIETVVATGRVKAVDITEITPALDIGDMSVRLGHRSVLAVMRGIKRAQQTGAA